MARPLTAKTLACLVATLGALGALRADEALLPGQVGRITDAALAEISGLAVSPSRKDVLWVINDSGNAPRLHALDRSGSLLAAITVTGARNRDWEDLAAFEQDGRSYLVIGEVGDNGARYPYAALYVASEPQDLATVDRVAVERVIYFRYPDGPRDAEGIAVDQDAGEVLVLAKRTTPPELYAVPLGADTPRPTHAVVARKVGTLTLPSPTALDLAADPATGIYSSQPTALDWSPAMGLLVMTYARPYLFPRQGGEPLADLLTRAPMRVDAPRLQQAEAAAFDGDAVLLTSEGLPAPLLRLPLRSRR
jgi:hypothetical protein